MLKQLHLTNFRKHEELSIDFSHGLNVIRGANEAGKSTTAEALLYALYGSSVLRTNLADTTTWGKQDNSLKVELVLSLSGKEYTFERSKAGATVYLNGQPHITGQREVSGFAAEMLGADAKTAAMLIMAEQAGLRGALDEGPTAVSGLIGKLADFEVIDRLIEAAQAKLLLGAEKPFVDKLEAAKLNLAAVDQQAIDPAELEQTRQAADAARTALPQAQAQYDTHMHAATSVAGQIQAEKDARARLERADQQVAMLEADLASLTQEYDRAVDMSRRGVPLVTMAQARAEAADEAQAADRLKWKKTVEAVAYPADFWEGDAASFQDSMIEAKASVATAETARFGALAQAKATRFTKITDGKCPTCGHAANSAEHVAEHNAKVEAVALGFDAEVAKAGEDLAAARAVYFAHQAVEKAATPTLTLIGSLANRDLPVAIDTNFYPPKVVWTGGEVLAGDAAKRKLADLEAQAKAAAVAEGRAASLQKQIQDKDTALASTKVGQGAIRVNPLEPLQREYDLALKEMSLAATNLQQTKELLAAAEQRLATLEAAAKDMAQARAQAEQRIAEVEADLKALALNNSVVRKLKALKPAITDYLWGQILSSVSAFFTQMRGEQSVVTKDSAGFKVNGKSIDGLSGSTLDALAIAVRVSLSKTFIPQAPFLVLDEPASGADGSRTASILGFLAGCGFDQVVLASHDAMSESVAENVILIGD